MPACTGHVRMSTRCWLCAISPAMIVGPKPGRPLSPTRTIKPPNANASDVNSAPRFLIPYLPSPPSILRQFLLLPLPSPCLQHRLARHPALQLPNLLPYPTAPQPTIPGAARPSEKPSISHLPKLPRKTDAHPFLVAFQIPRVRPKKQGDREDLAPTNEKAPVLGEKSNTAQLSAPPAAWIGQK